MKRKKGFTLIELLAVIVILAIIALITVPTVIKIINNAKKGAAEDSKYGAAEDSTYGAVEAAKLYWASHATFDNENESEGVTFTCGNDGCKYNDDILDISGDKPTSGTITISSGNVTASNLVFGNFTCSLSNDIVTCGSDSIPEPPAPEGPTKVAAAASDTHKGIVYLDPTNLTNTCNADNSVSTTGTKTGCMKWYIYDDSGSNYTMILDHNTTATVAWNSSMNNADGMNEVATALATDTAGWQGSPRLITANEIARITGNTGFDASQTGMGWFCLDTSANYYLNSCEKEQGTSAYKWLFDNTKGCTSYGCDTNSVAKTYGYWTSTPFADGTYYAWNVYNIGLLYYSRVDDESLSGVRPVITISKSVIN